MWDVICGKGNHHLTNPVNRISKFRKLALFMALVQEMENPDLDTQRLRRVIKVPLTQEWIESSFSLGTSFSFCAFINSMLLLLLCIAFSTLKQKSKKYWWATGNIQVKRQNEKRKDYKCINLSES